MHDTAALEAAVKSLWQSTSTTLTDAAIASALGLATSEVAHGMRALLRRGAVDMSVTDLGELCWSVPGVARRPAHVKATSAVVSTKGLGLKVRFEQTEGSKSVLLSAAMGVLFGPFGWLYAAPWLEALAAITLYSAVGYFFPRFLLGAFFGLVHPTCGVLAMLYAWRFNQTKARSPIFFVSPTPRPS